MLLRSFPEAVPTGIPSWISFFFSFSFMRVTLRHLVERQDRIELSSPAWQDGVMAVIRLSQGSSRPVALWKELPSDYLKGTLWLFISISARFPHNLS